MAWRYRNRVTKALVDSATYHRSRSQGGTKFERFSDAKWRTSRGRAGKSLPKKPTGGSKPKASPSAKAPQTPAEFERMFEEKKLKKMSKKRRAEFYQEEYDGPEYETGVDY
jgi:hypothetical protein